MATWMDPARWRSDVLFPGSNPNTRNINTKWQSKVGIWLSFSLSSPKIFCPWNVKRAGSQKCGGKGESLTRNFAVQVLISLPIGIPQHRPASFWWLNWKCLLRSSLPSSSTWICKWKREKTYANRHKIHRRPAFFPLFIYTKAPACPRDQRLRKTCKTFFNEKYHFAQMLTPTDA